MAAPAGDAIPRDPGEADSPRHPRRRRLVRRGLLLAATALVVVVAVLVIADVASGAAGEHRLSQSLRASPRVEFDPEVTLSGFPYITHALAGSFSGATITARGVPVAGCAPLGQCRAELGATLGSLRVGHGWSIGPSDRLRTNSLSTYTRLDSVNLGRFLRILDLTVNTPAPHGEVGGGGPQDGLLHRTSGVVLTGTVATGPSSALRPSGPPTPTGSPSAAEYHGRSVTVSVSVDLSIRDGRLHLQATDFYTGPENHVSADGLSGSDAAARRAVLDRFTATLPQLPLAWGTTATTAESEGSDVLLKADVGARTLRPDGF